MDEDLSGHSRADSTLAVVVVAGVVAATWVTVAVGLISFGPGSALLATAVLAICGIGWVTSALMPLPGRARVVAAGVVVVGAVLLGPAIADWTPPRDEAVALELATIGSSFVDTDSVPSLSMRVAPWEAGLATLPGVVVAADSEVPIEVVEAALVEQGFAVSVLNEAGDGLSQWEEHRGPSSDLAASRDRWNLRASLDQDRIYLRLRWTPVVTTIDPFHGDGGGSGILGGMGTFAGGLVFHWAAALIALFGGVFALASAASITATFAGWFRRRGEPASAR